MEVKEIEVRVTKVIDVEMVGDPWEFHQDFNDDMHMDSLDRSSILVEVESEFDITIFPCEIEDITTPRKLVELVQEKLK